LLNRCLSFSERRSAFGRLTRQIAGSLVRYLKAEYEVVRLKYYFEFNDNFSDGPKTGEDNCFAASSIDLDAPTLESMGCGLPRNALTPKGIVFTQTVEPAA
jgi:hypothetical protein